MRGVWPSCVMHSSVSPDRVPTPSKTANTAPLPSVQSLHRARSDTSLVGSIVTIKGLIIRPFIPPEALIWLTKRLIAFVCSLYSRSLEKPRVEESAVRFEIGNATVIVDDVTPTLLVLAFWSALTVVGVVDPVALLSLGDELDVAAYAMPTTTTIVSIPDATRTPSGLRWKRRHDRPSRPPP